MIFVFWVKMYIAGQMVMSVCNILLQNLSNIASYARILGDCW